jgi:p-hydroxybenzoate 3-monooxygenase
MAIRTQVGIVGAGPSGLLLSHLLHLEGIESVVLEIRSRRHVESRIRAGVLEQGTVDILRETGLGDRLQREGLVHHGIELRLEGQRHRIPLSELTAGRTLTIYDQQKVVNDLAEARLAAGGQVQYEVADVRVDDLDSAAPTIHYRKDGAAHELRCDVIAGCDGFHGVCRPSIPRGALTVYERVYPFAWLGILAAVHPSVEEMTYAPHDRGFALHSLRSPELSRLYLQCAVGEDLANWPDERIWDELAIRLGTDDGWTLKDGPILEKTLIALRSFVVEPMQYGRLFLVGDAAHIVPATGAKGLNLAVVDVQILAHAVAAFYRSGRADALDRYSEACLRRVWRIQQFSRWWTLALHRFPGDDFRRRLQRSELEYLLASKAAATSMAENYVGMPLDRPPALLASMPREHAAPV